jgi:hypothetical protein
MHALFFKGDPEYVLAKVREILKPPTRGPETERLNGIHSGGLGPIVVSFFSGGV